MADQSYHFARTLSEVPFADHFGAVSTPIRGKSLTTSNRHLNLKLTTYNPFSYCSLLYMISLKLQYKWSEWSEWSEFGAFADHFGAALSSSSVMTVPTKGGGLPEMVGGGLK